MGDDFGAGLAAIPSLATAHADPAEGLGAIGFLCAHFVDHAAQFAGGDAFAAADNGLVAELARLFGEARLGPLSLIATGAFEGLLFGACVVGGITLARRSLARGA